MRTAALVAAVAVCSLAVIAVVIAVMWHYDARALRQEFELSRRN